MVFKTRFTEMLGIEHPIMCGGMHYVSYAPLIAAVSNAGGIGFLTALTQPDPESLRKEIRKTRTLTSKPFGVNVSFLPASAPPDYAAYIKVIIEEGVKVVETAGNNPGKWIKMLKDGGVLVIHKCVTVRHAHNAIKLGADVISMDGYECAGHPGMEDIGGLVLLAMAARKLDVPFIASGGIADGKQLAACLALGAEGVNMGTRFMATQEAPIHNNIKDTLVKKDQSDTMLILKSLKNTERVFKNDQAKIAAEEEARNPGDVAVIIKHISGSKYKESFHQTGNSNDSVWSAGVVMGLIEDVPTVKGLVDGMISEATEVIEQRLTGLVSKL